MGSAEVIGLAPELAKCNTNDICHHSPTLGKEIFIIHLFPFQWKRVLRAHTAPPVVVDADLLAQAGDIIGRTMGTNYIILVPTGSAKFAT